MGGLGANLFYAKWSIKVGDSIVEKINSALSSYDYLLVILSTSSINSDWVKMELNSSLMRQLSQNNIKVIPALLEKCEIPILLTDIKYADFTNNYSSGLQDLIYSFEEEFELEFYLDIVDKACSKIESTSEKRELAINLKLINPIPFFRNEILSNIFENKNITKENLFLKLFSTKHNNPDAIKVAEMHLEHLLEDKLIEMSNNKTDISITPLGENIYNCLSYGFNEGYLSPACSS